MASAVRSRLIPALMLLVIVAAIWWARRRPPQQENSFAYVSDRSVIVWSTTAQVRQRVADLTYGQRVAVVSRSGDQIEVRSDDGVQGWVDSQLLMPPDLWQRAGDLLKQARAMPVQAVGHTRAPSNVHLEATRTGTRVFQFGRNARVAVLERKVSAAAATAGASSDDGTAASGTGEAKQEDWLLVLHDVAQGGAPATASTTSDTQALPAPNSNPGVDVPVAGWVLARFVALDPPAVVSDYANSAGLRAVAWLQLNAVTDAGAAHPQYLVAGAHGGEGQPCDFTALRVYTWGQARQRYETAYVENDLCGQFPIRTKAAPDGAEFRFVEIDENNTERLYRMKQTIVRRVRENSPASHNTR